MRQLELVLRHFGEGGDIDIVADSLKAFDDVHDVAEDRHLDELLDLVHALLVVLLLLSWNEMELVCSMRGIGWNISTII